MLREVNGWRAGDAESGVEQTFHGWYIALASALVSVATQLASREVSPTGKFTIPDHRKEGHKGDSDALQSARFRSPTRVEMFTQQLL